MEPTKSVIKEVLRAAHQYHNNSAQFAYLLRQLEALQRISSKSTYIHLLQTSDQVELVECLTFLVDVVRERHDNLEMVQRAISVLLNLSQDESVKKLLHETLNLCPSLVSLVVAYSGLTEEEQTLSDAMQLLQRITYGHRMDYYQANVEDLLKFLIPHILSKTESLLLPILGTLANLCRNNLLVQAAIRNKGQSELKKLLKTLCEFLDSPNHLIVIFSLSVFSSLCLTETEGQKLFFEGNNVEQTLQTIFGVIKNGFRTVAWKYAADLLTDLLRHPQMQICIKKYRHLPKCINGILSQLSTSTDECISDIFQLLQNLCVIPSVQQTINCRLFTPLAQNSISSIQMLEVTNQSLQPDAEPLLVCLHWTAQEVTQRSCASCLTLDFLIDACQDCLCAPEKLYPVHLLTPVLVHLISRQEQTACVEKTIRLIRLLSVLQQDKHCRELIGSHLKVDIIASLVEKQTSHNNVSYSVTGNSSSLADEKAREQECQCVLLLLDLALKVQKCVTGLPEYLENTLQITRLMDFLAMGLTSDNQELVEISVRLLCFTLGVDNARPDVILCGSIACLNKQKQSSKRFKVNSDSPQRAAVSPGNILSNKENRPFMSNLTNCEQKIKLGLDRSSKEEASNIDSLIERMEGIIGTKDTKTAEVIEVFEHHIRSLQIKEEHLNNLLEVKNLALTQADRVIAQLRGIQASHTAEMNKLQNVLKESEKRNEQIVSQMNDMKIEADKMQSQFEKQIDHIKEEIEALSHEKDEMTDKCAELEEKLANCRQENKTLSTLMTELQDTHKVLKEKYNIMSNQCKQLEDERKTLSKQLKDKDSMLQKQSVTLQTLQAKYKETEEERAELEKEKENIEAYVDKLQHQLSSSESTCRQLQQRVTVLESINQDLEEKLKQKLARVEELEAELDKHNQIVSFINNMQLKGGASKK